MWTKSPGAILLLCFLLAACDESPTSPDAVSRVAAVASANGIRLTNNGETPLAFAAIDPRALARLALCVDPSAACVRLPAKGSLFVPYSDVLFFESDTTEATVHWWHVVAVPGGYQASDPQSLVVNVVR